MKQTEGSVREGLMGETARDDNRERETERERGQESAREVWGGEAESDACTDRAIEGEMAPATYRWREGENE